MERRSSAFNVLGLFIWSELVRLRLAQLQPISRLLVHFFIRSALGLCMSGTNWKLPDIPLFDLLGSWNRWGDFLTKKQQWACPAASYKSYRQPHVQSHLLASNVTKLATFGIRLIEDWQTPRIISMSEALGLICCLNTEVKVYINNVLISSLVMFSKEFSNCPRNIEKRTILSGSIQIPFRSW